MRADGTFSEFAVRNGAGIGLGSAGEPSFRRFLRRPACQPPPEKCAVNARANEPKPPRVTPPDPVSDEVPEGE